MPSPDRVRKLTLVAALATLTAACLPFRQSGYEVSGKGTRVQSPYVWFIRDNLRLQAHSGVVLLISADAQQGSPLQIRLEINIPKGVRVRWLGTAVTYRSSGWDQPRVGRLSEIRNYGGGYWNPTDWLEGTQSGAWFDKGSPYYTYIPGAAGHSGNVDSDGRIREFSMDLPTLEVDGKAFDPGTITVRRYQRWGLGLLAQ
jgi:hypothetical protein